MDDDLTEFEELTDDMLGDELTSMAPNSEDFEPDDPGLMERFNHGLDVVVNGGPTGIQYPWRDRAIIVARGLTVTVLVAAVAALVFDAASIRDGPIWELRVTARSALLTGFDVAGEMAGHLLNNPAVAVVVAALLVLLLWREV